MKINDFCKRNAEVCQEWKMEEQKHKSFTGKQTKLKEYSRLKKKDDKDFSATFSQNEFKKIFKQLQNTNN